MAKSIVEYFTPCISRHKQVKEYLKGYYRERAGILVGNGFDPAIVFGKGKRNDVLNTLGVDEGDFDRYKKTHILLKRDFEVSGNPLNLSLLVVSVKKNDNDLMDFIALRMFSSFINKYFSSGVDAARLNYVISTLDSSWDIVKYDNILESLNSTMNTVRKTYARQLKRLSDDDIVYVINQISSRVNDKVKKVSNKYYESEKAFYKEKENLDRDELRHTTTETLKFDDLIKSVSYQIINTGLDINTLKQVKGMQFKEAMDLAHRNNSKDLLDIVEILVNQFLKAYPNVSIIEAKKKFIAYSVTNKRRKDISIIIDKIISQNKIKYGGKFQPILIKYLILKIHNRLISY